MQNTTLAGRYRQQSPPEEGFVVWLGCLTMTYFRTGYPHYHRRCLVSRSCSGWEGVGPRRYGRQTESGGRKKSSGKRGLIARVTAVKARSRGATLPCRPSLLRTSALTHRYRIKPHGQLVSVSLTHYCASTPDLSTSWSRTTL